MTDNKIISPEEAFNWATQVLNKSGGTQMDVGKINFGHSSDSMSEAIRRLQDPSLKDRVAYLEKQVAWLKEQIHELKRNPS